MRLRAEARQIPWVKEAAVRLREHGHTVTGEVFVVPRADGLSAADLLTVTERAAARLERADWRLHGLMVIPVRALEGTSQPRVAPTVDVREESRDAAD